MYGSKKTTQRPTKNCLLTRSTVPALDETMRENSEMEQQLLERSTPTSVFVPSSIHCGAVDETKGGQAGDAASTSALPRPSFLPLRHFNQLQSGRWGRIAQNGPRLNANTHSYCTFFGPPGTIYYSHPLPDDVRAFSVAPPKTIFVFRLSSSECQVTN